MIAPARSSSLSASLDAQTVDERQRTLVGLLRRPILLANGPDAELFALVRRHADWLRNWFARYPGWLLTIDAEAARLRKIPANPQDTTRGARDERTGQPFNRRRYVVLCLALAALETCDRQTTLGLVAERVLGFAAGDPELTAAGFGFDLQTRDQRRDLVKVVRLLLDLGVLRRVDGDEEAFVNQQGDVLYNINRSALSGMLCVRHGPSLIDAESVDERIASVNQEPMADSAEGRNQRRRASLMRRLLDDPVLYYEDLMPDELEYLTSQRPRLMAAIRDATGLTPEVRREGIAVVDETTASTDLALPEEGTDGHATLLLAEYLANRLRADGPRPVSVTCLEQFTTDLIKRYRTYWRKDVCEPGAERCLVRTALQHLCGLRLVKLTQDGVIPQPAIGRYALDAEPVDEHPLLGPEEPQ